MKKDIEIIDIARPILAHSRKNGQYLFDKSDLTNQLEVGKDIVIPLVIDTEYWQPNYKDFLASNEQLEFKSPKGNTYKSVSSNFWQHGRYGVTTQVKGICENEGVILAHSDLIEVANQLGKDIRHPVAKSGFHPIDYLNQIGVETRLNRVDKVIKEYKGERIATCEFVLYSHFALAELLMIVDGEYRKDLEKIALSTNPKNGSVEMQRRLRVATSGVKGADRDNIDLPWLVVIQGQMYRVKLCIIDTFAIHGVASYKDLCESAGIKLESKTKMDVYKTMMHIGYFEEPDDFDTYSLGDLEVYNAVYNNAENFRKIWESLEIKEYFQPPRLTIGSTVRDIFVAKVCKEFGLNPNDKSSLEKVIDLLGIDTEDKNIKYEQIRKELLNKVCRYGTAEYLKNFTTSTQCLNAKVEGGRCRNNRPNLVSLKGVLLDIDYSGCYGEGQRNQLYPFGRPLVDEFDIPSKINDYPTLRTWLKARKHNTAKCELVAGLWQARVSTKVIYDGDRETYTRLKFEQDYLASWFDFKITDIAEMKTDSELVDNELNEQLEVKTGLTKIFNSQVVNGVITHDFVDWLFNVCGEKQRKDLLDNLYVHTAVYYPAYDRVYSAEELLIKIAQHDGINKSKTKQRVGGSRKLKVTEECTAWYGVNLGEFIIDDLLAYRKIYPKKNSDGSKNPMNTLYKLCVNTLYGDMVSPFFSISNVVVGNNITARARAACYYAEKGFYGVQSITDGVAFDLNNVVYSIDGRRVTAQSVVNLHKENDVLANRGIKLKSIGNYDDIKIDWIEIKTGKYLPKLELIKNGVSEFLEPENLNGEWTNPAHNWIDKIAMEHLQNLFNVDVLQAESTILKVTKGQDGKPIKKFIPNKGQFIFESKSYYTEGYFHGSANYYLKGLGGNNLAMRSYEKREHEEVNINDDEQLVLSPYLKGVTPAEFFMSQLDNPRFIKRSKVFVKQGILKINDARIHSQRWLRVGRMPGDTIQKSGLLREFSLSQFTFQTIEQFKNLSREVDSNKRKFNQSYEGFFVNDDDTLNFETMVKEIDLNIGNGESTLNKIFDKSRNRHRIDMIHPETVILKCVQNTLLKPNLEESERDWFESSGIIADEDGLMYEVDWETMPSINATAEDLADFEFSF
jgi:hypothetical protein